MRPASITTMFSSYSSAIMLRPISPSPPRGMARNLGCLAKKGELLLRLGDWHGGCGNRLSSLLCPVEVRPHGFEILLQRSHQKTVIQGGRWMVDGDVAHAVLDDHFSVQTGDGFITWQQTRQRMPAQYQDDLRPDQAKLLREIRRTGLHFGRLWIPIVRWAALEDIGDEDIAAREADSPQELVEQLACCADEGFALQVFVLAGRLPNHHNPGVLRTDTRDCVRSTGA